MTVHSEMEVRDVHVGAIYPFAIPHRFDISKLRGSNRELFRVPPDAEKLGQLRRLNYEPELQWRDPSSLLFLSTKLTGLKTPSHKPLDGVSARFYVFLYPTVGIGTIVCWIDCPPQPLRWRELLHLADFARGMRAEEPVEFSWDRGSQRSHSLVEMCHWLRTQLLSSGPAGGETLIEFAHPILYVGDVVGSDTAGQIVFRHDREIAAIANLWPKDFEYMKDEEVTRIISSDYHPFTYGVTCASHSCTIELHAKRITAQRAVLDGLTIEEQNYREQMLLSFLVELPVAQYFAIRTINQRLADLYVQTGMVDGDEVDFGSMSALRGNLPRLARNHYQIARAFNEFRSVYLKRQSYVGKAMRVYRTAFGIEEVEASVERQLTSLSTVITAGYTMLISELGVVLAVIGTVLAILQLVLAIRGGS